MNFNKTKTEFLELTEIFVSLFMISFVVLLAFFSATKLVGYIT